jgi:hypothetical protein
MQSMDSSVWIARLFGGAAAVALGACLWRDSLAKLEEYEEKYPPISDEEFLRRCSPDVRPDVALQVRGIIADVFGVERENIHPETNLIELDSL